MREKGERENKRERKEEKKSPGALIFALTPPGPLLPNPTRNIRFFRSMIYQPARGTRESASSLH